MISPELQSKLIVWRQKAASGTLSIEEMREAILVMRQDRLAAASTAKASSKRAAPRSADDLLEELGGL